MNYPDRTPGVPPPCFPPAPPPPHTSHPLHPHPGPSTHTGTSDLSLSPPSELAMSDCLPFLAEPIIETTQDPHPKVHLQLQSLWRVPTVAVS